MERLKRYLGVMGIFLMVMSAASPALAAAALFSGTLQTLGFGGTATVPVSGLPTQGGNLQGGTGPAGFTVPSNIWGVGLYSFTFSFPPTYVYVKAIKSNMAYAGNFTKSYFTPSASFTQMHNETLYPNAAPTSPAPGFVRMKIGPKGFGGPMPFRRRSTYIQTVVAVPGYSTGTFAGSFTYGDGAGGNSAFRDCCGFSYNVNTVTGGKNGAAWVWDPTNAFATGTITASGPLGAAEYFTVMAVDGRNAAGTTGTIQMMAPRISHNYSLPGQVPPEDGTGIVGGPTWDSAGGLKVSLTFVPEPGHSLLLGSGILGLLGLYLWRRRR